MSETQADEGPILLLHSSCTGGHEVTASSEGASPTGGDIDDCVDETGLTKQQIVCDLLLVPERHSTPDDYLNIPRTPINPCGISNVLTLENFPKRWKSQPMLLSLTSCGIFHTHDDKNIAEELASSNWLPVEPIPSTFVLDLKGHRGSGVDLETGRIEKNQYDSTINAVKKLSEITVLFDVCDASRLANELIRLRQENSTTTIEAKEAPELKVDPNTFTDYQHQHEDMSDSSSILPLQDSDMERLGKGEDSSAHELNSRSEDFARDFLFNESFSRKDFQDQKLLLADLRVRIEQDVQRMDLLLRISFFFGLLLLVVLIWAIYQYYRSTLKSDVFSREIRECMKTTRDLLKDAIDKLHQYHIKLIQQRHSMNTVNRKRSHSSDEAIFPIGLDENYRRDRIDIEFTNNLVRQSRDDLTKQSSSSSFNDYVSAIGRKNNMNRDHFAPMSDGVGKVIDHREEFSTDSKKIQESENKNRDTPVLADAIPTGNCNHDFGPTLTDKRLEGHKGKDRVPDTPTPSNITSSSSTSSNNDSRNKTIASSDVISKEEKAQAKVLDGAKGDNADKANSSKINSPPVQLPKFSSLQQQECKKKLCFLGSFASRSKKEVTLTSDLEMTDPMPHSHKPTKDPEGGKVMYKTTNQAKEASFSLRSQLDDQTTVEPKKGAASKPLSPCSKLAKEWNEVKTIRRSNLSKRRSYIKPIIVQSNAEPSSSSSNNAYNDGEGKMLFEPTIHSRVPQKSKLGSMNYRQQFFACTIPAPPKLRSIARNESQDNDENTKSLPEDEGVTENATPDIINRKITIMKGMNTPPNSTTQKAPRLCYTPASEDDSFVDDYW